MEVVKSYKDLLIWKKGMEISASVYKLTNDFSEEEKFGLISQLRRATVSVPSNIAEGYGRGSTKSYIQFVKISRGSLYEVETQLLLAFKLGFIKNEELYIEIANVDPASNSNLRIAPNGVTNLGYTVGMSGGGVTVHEQGYWKINQVWAMTASNTNNIVTMYVHNYTSTTDFKTAESNNLFQALGQSGLRIIYSGHGFESTSAITSLQFSQDSGNQNGGTVRIYGVK